jgi:hypothetical protein
LSAWLRYCVEKFPHFNFLPLLPFIIMCWIAALQGVYPFFIFGNIFSYW